MLCWLYPLNSKEAGSIANILRTIFQDHGAPHYLHSDNGTEFVNRFVKDVCDRFNTKIVHGRPYHPQSQGQVENLNRRVKNCLRHFLLQYPEEQRSEVWPKLVKEVEYFLNHSWHHTVRSTPYSIFLGRFRLRNVGKVPVQPEYMEEDFIYATNIDNDFEFDLHAQSDTAVSIPDYDMRDNEALTVLVSKRSLQEQQKMDTFEATEATITRNRRSQVKKIRGRTFSVGDGVLFKNPKRSGLATTLNVAGCIEEKVGRDLYRVGYGGEHVTLFASEMVPNTTLSKSNSDTDIQTSRLWETHAILDKICVYADMQRSFFSARRKYKQGMDVMDMERKIKDIGYTFDVGNDLTSLFYIALDCGFMSILTEDHQWNTDLETLSTSVLAFLQEKRFHYFLSGIYWWECFRCQTVHIFIQCIMDKAIPLFHYCSECIDEGKCSHACCKLWLVQACVDRRIEVQLPGATNEDGLLMLATVAIEQSEQQKATHQKSITKQATSTWPLQKPVTDIHT